MIPCAFCNALMSNEESRCSYCDQERVVDDPPKNVPSSGRRFHTRLYLVAVISIIGSIILLFQLFAMGIEAPAEELRSISGAIGIVVFGITMLCFVMLGKRWARNTFLISEMISWVFFLTQGDIFFVIVSILLVWFMFSKDWSRFNPEYGRVKEIEGE